MGIIVTWCNNCKQVIKFEETEEEGEIVQYETCERCIKKRLEEKG